MRFPRLSDVIGVLHYLSGAGRRQGADRVRVRLGQDLYAPALQGALLQDLTDDLYGLETR